MCFGCVASDGYWDAAAEDESLESSEQQDRGSLEMLRASLHAGLVRLEEDQAAKKATAGAQQQ